MIRSFYEAEMISIALEYCTACTRSAFLIRASYRQTLSTGCVDKLAWLIDGLHFSL